MATRENAPEAIRRGAPPPSHRGRKKQPLYEAMRDSIMAGEFEPGEPLIELSLADWYGVSRTPIREAMTRLEQDGLLARTDRGLAVPNRTPEDVLDLYDTRIALEATAARTAADRRTSHDVMELHRLANVVSAIPASAAKEMAASNTQFHRAIWKASRNNSLIDLLERLNMHLGRYPETTLSFPGRRERANEQHQRLVAAIEARHIEAAAAIATEHFTESRDIRVKLWAGRETF
jgi:DNA-binding GntR family transcriptional regulator